jgi:hypothetical protein
MLVKLEDAQRLSCWGDVQCLTLAIVMKTPHLCVRHDMGAGNTMTNWFQVWVPDCCTQALLYPFPQCSRYAGTGISVR